MKVCHITSGHPPFDVRIFQKECRSLAKAGHDVTLIAPADFKEQVVDGVRVLGVSRPRGRRERAHVWRELIGAVRRLKPDVVHFHDPDVLLLTPFLGHRPVIYDCHERNAVAMLNKPWLPGPLRRPAYLLVSFLEPALARRAAAIVLVDETQIETFRKTGKPLVMVKNYPILEEKSTAAERDPRAVVYAGANARSRGCGVMIEAFERVIQQVPGATLWLVGPFNHPPYEAEIRHLIKRRGLGDTVKLVGRVSHPEALRWIERAAVGLNAYQSVPQYRECLPTKVLEYMAAGIPVVASDVPANRNIVQDAGCGLLSEPADSGQYADAIVYLLTHPVEARQMGEFGRRAVLTRYNWRQAEENLLALYASLSDGRSTVIRATSGRGLPANARE